MDDGQKKYSDKKDGENDLELIVDATPAVDDGPPIPPGHQRFFCEKCRALVRPHRAYKIMMYYF